MHAKDWFATFTPQTSHHASGHFPVTWANVVSQIQEPSSHQLAQKMISSFIEHKQVIEGTNLSHYHHNHHHHCYCLHLTLAMLQFVMFYLMKY
jgi:hypothetical protein